MIIHSVANTYVCVFPYECAYIVYIFNTLFCPPLLFPLPLHLLFTFLLSPPSSLSHLSFLEANTTSNTQNAITLILSIGKLILFSSRKACFSWSLGLKTILPCTEISTCRGIVNGVLTITPIAGQRRRSNTNSSNRGRELAVLAGSCQLDTS